MGSEHPRTKPSDGNFSFLSGFLILCLLLSVRRTYFYTEEHNLQNSYKSYCIGCPRHTCKVGRISIHSTFSFTQRGNWNLKKLTHLPKATKLVIGKTGIWTQIIGFLSHQWCVLSCLSRFRTLRNFYELFARASWKLLLKKKKKQTSSHLPLCGDETPSMNTHLLSGPSGWQFHLRLSCLLKHTVSCIANNLKYLHFSYLTRNI